MALPILVRRCFGKHVDQPAGITDQPDLDACSHNRGENTDDQNQTQRAQMRRQIWPHPRGRGRARSQDLGISKFQRLSGEPLKQSKHGINRIARVICPAIRVEFHRATSPCAIQPPECFAAYPRNFRPWPGWGNPKNNGARKCALTIAIKKTGAVPAPARQSVLSPPRLFERPRRDADRTAFKRGHP